MKLQAKDLMIGDWVYNKNTNRNIQVYPTMFSQMFRQHPDATTEDYNIFPIPLTGEILEKNGWIKEWGLEWNNDDAIDLQAEWEDDRFWWFLGDTPVVAINYVHELQHALKLRGIEKEIEL